MKIGSRTIGDGRTFIIAEIGISHNGNLDIAKQLIDVAAEAKVDAVKFQKRHLPSLYPPDVLENPWKYEQHFQYMIPILKVVELLDEAHIGLKEYAESKGLEYLCTPFDIKSVHFLGELGVRAFKISSADLTNISVIAGATAYDVPIILSTGMSSWEEITKTVKRLKNEAGHIPIALLHCRSAYPVWPREANLKMITKLKEFGVPVGYSGHDIGTTIPLIAASMGACIIEKHITLDRTMKGPDHKVSLEPDELKVLVRDIRVADQAMAKPSRFLLRGEIMNRDLFRYKGRYPENGKEHTVPDLGDSWGLIARHSDIDEVAKFNPKIIEYRMAEQDFGKFVPKDYSAFKLVVHAPEYIGDKILDLCSGDREIRERSILMVKNTIQEAWKISECFEGYPQIIVHLGAMSMNQVLKPHALKKCLLDSLNQILNTMLAPILLENLPPYPWYFGGQWKGNFFMDADEIKEICDETGINICFDLSHAALYCHSREKSLARYIETVKPYVRHYHIADSYGLDGEGCQIDSGDICMREIIPLLFDGYAGAWCPEVWRGHQNNHSGAIEALNRLKKYME